MTKVIGLNECVAPANVEAFKIAGGALTNGLTYHYKVVATGYNDFYWSTACWLSVPSAEVSITADATNRTAIIHGDDATGTDSVLATDYILYSTTTSGDYSITTSAGVVRTNVANPVGFRSNHWNSVRVDNVTTYRRFTMTTSAIASLVPNETLTGATSGATALVLTDPAGGTTFKVWTITGTFSAGENLNGSVSGLVGTFTSLSGRDGFVLTDNVTSGGRYPYYENGAPVITVAGGTESDPVRIQDINDYLISIGKTYCLEGIPLFPTGQYVNTSGNDICNVWNFKANIVSNDTVGYFKVGGGEVLNFNGVKHIFRNHTIFGEVDSNGNTTCGCAIVGTWPLAFYNGFAQGAGSNKVYGSMLGMNYRPFGDQVVVGNSNNNPYYQTSFPWEVYDSVILSGGRFNNQSKIYNSRMMISGEIGGATNGEGWETVNAQFNAIVTNPTNSGDSTYKNFIVNHVSSPDFRVRAYGGSERTMVFHIVSPTIKRGTIICQAQSEVSATNWDAMMFVKRKMNMKVLDESENALENVKVCIQDKDDKDCIFEEDSIIYSTTSFDRTATSFTTTGGSLVVGSYYKLGDEILLVTANPSGTTYTVSRAQFGTTAGIHKTTIRKYFYKMLDCIYTDSNGNTDLVLTSDKFKKYFVNPTAIANLTENLTGESQSPFTITLSKDGYETLIIKGNINEDLNCKYTLKKAIDTMITNKGVGIRADPTNSTKDRDLVILP